MHKYKVSKRIEKFNQGRDSESLALKYQKMRDNPFAFLRGTNHLFYEDWDGESFLNKAPLSWVCGDLHLENFGSYKGDDRLTYFDINDFDEAILAPCTLDLARLLTSIFLAFPATEEREDRPEILADFFLDAYVNSLLDGKARWLEREISRGLVKELLDKQAKIKRKDFIEERTEITESGKKIKIRPNKIRPISDAKKEEIKLAIDEFAKHQENPDFFHFIDCAWRIAGNASLGLQRYIILVEGKGSPDGNYLLDLKEASISSLEKYINVRQLKWKNQAQRVVAIQTRMQAISPALLNTIVIDNDAFVLREYQPSEEKVDLESAGENWQELTELMVDTGQIVAWSQLRSSGRQGSAIADDLIIFAKEHKWRKEILKYAQKYSKKVEAYWQEFKSMI